MKQKVEKLPVSIRIPAEHVEFVDDRYHNRSEFYAAAIATAIKKIERKELAK